VERKLGKGADRIAYLTSLNPRNLPSEIIRTGRLSQKRGKNLNKNKVKKQKLNKWGHKKRGGILRKKSGGRDRAEAGAMGYPVVFKRGSRHRLKQIKKNGGFHSERGERGHQYHELK